jgi:hypothetical protein
MFDAYFIVYNWVILQENALLFQHVVVHFLRNLKNSNAKAGFS